MKDFTDSLFEEYAKANAINNVDEFLDEVAAIIVENKGEIDYNYFKKIFDGKSLDYDNFVTWAFFAFAITKHIPKYINMNRIIRTIPECFHDTLTFLYTRLEEDLMLEYSHNNKAGLPPLRRRDTADNNKFHPGTGKSIADFETIEEPHIGYEMKASSNSPSSYHDSRFIIITSKDDNYKYVVYRLSEPGNVILPATKYVLEDFVKLYRSYSEFNRLTTEDRSKFSEENFALLDSKLAELGFVWPK